MQSHYVTKNGLNGV